MAEKNSGQPIGYAKIHQIHFAHTHVFVILKNYLLVLIVVVIKDHFWLLPSYSQFD